MLACSFASCMLRSSSTAWFEEPLQPEMAEVKPQVLAFRPYKPIGSIQRLLSTRLYSSGWWRAVRMT